MEDLWETRNAQEVGSNQITADSILNYLMVPSPPAGLLFGRYMEFSTERTAAGGTSVDSPPGDGIPIAQVEHFAGMGLTLQEILAALNHWAPLSGEEKSALDIAIAKGRAKGSARIKEAYYNGAIDGAISAQKHLLDMLEEPEINEVKSPTRIVRKILE